MYVSFMPAHVIRHVIRKCNSYIIACMYGLFHLLSACDPTMKEIEQIWKPTNVDSISVFLNLIYGDKLNAYGIYN